MTWPAEGWRRLYLETGKPEAREMALERARNVAAVLRQAADGTWWVPYRVRWIEDGSMPDIRPMSPDIVSPLYGPNGLFAWAALGLRVFVMMTEGATGDEAVLRIRAAKALRWMDAEQRPHLVDAHMSLRWSWADVVEEALESDA